MVQYLRRVSDKTRHLSQHLSQYRASISSHIPGVGVRSDMLVQVEAGLASKTQHTMEDIQMLYKEMKTLKSHIEQV